MRWPLRYQILIPFTAVLIVAIAAVSIISSVLAAKRARAQIETQLRNIATTLAESSFQLTDAVLQQMHGLSGADFAFVDEDDRVVAASRSIALPAGVRAAPATATKELGLDSPVSIDGEQYFQTVMAIGGRGSQEPGKLHLLYPVRIWQEAISEAATPPLVVGGIALVVTALVALVIAARFTRPILELRRQVQRIAEADFTPMPLPSRNDELRDLAVAVNRLAERLTTMERAIRRGERLALLGQLAGGLAHQLRNHVTGARMAVQLHQRQCADDRESLDVALRQLTLTEDHLKQLLTSPQVGSHLASEPRLEKCRLSDIIDEVAKLIGPSLEHRRIELAVVAPFHEAKNSAANVATDEILADSSQLRQAILNLVINASEAVGPGGEVRLETIVSPEDVTIRVCDNGPGPLPEIVERLFEPFATSKPEGVGLGLFVAKQIATRHGGRLEYKRAESQTCFELTLPRGGGAASDEH